MIVSFSCEAAEVGLPAMLQVLILVGFVSVWIVAATTTQERVPLLGRHRACPPIGSLLPRRTFSTFRASVKSIELPD